ncbi:hypothetical protein CDEST_00959 [Colletotrichum destructivum]|uniref:Uncharacterized protein n=1 Tax=Colletotrichum destructivum TaxID=34406 RepID=A0AAX4HYW8_9PEZI|nr:hypothetical protein CDEST_00959 [Colletotrichum destructivum]
MPGQGHKRYRVSCARERSVKAENALQTRPTTAAAITRHNGVKPAQPAQQKTYASESAASKPARAPRLYNRRGAAPNRQRTPLPFHRQHRATYAKSVTDGIVDPPQSISALVSLDLVDCRQSHVRTVAPHRSRAQFTSHAKATEVTKKAQLERMAALASEAYPSTHASWKRGTGIPGQAAPW